jgi:uncharacterized Zn finger protein
MRIVIDSFICNQCKNEFEHEVVDQAPVAVWAASIRAVKCPKCGANSKSVSFLRTSPKQLKPKEELPQEVSTH